jgi:hypothetical protein
MLNKVYACKLFAYPQFMWCFFTLCISIVILDITIYYYKPLVLLRTNSMKQSSYSLIVYYANAPKHDRSPATAAHHPSNIHATIRRFPVILLHSSVM